jgi:TnpA family transposase
MRILARDGKTTGLGSAVAEVGRVAKTLYLLDYLDDEAYRRRILVQLNLYVTRTLKQTWTSTSIGKCKLGY